MRKYILVWKRRYADVRAGTQAPPLQFRLGGLRVNVEWHLGRLRVEQLVSLGQITRKWLFCLYGIVWKNMMEMGRGGACVPARVACRDVFTQIITTQTLFYFKEGGGSA